MSEDAKVETKIVGNGDGNGKTKVKILGRKFMTMLAFWGIVILNRKMNLGLEQADLWVLAVVAVGAIFGESLPDSAGALKAVFGAAKTPEK